MLHQPYRLSGKVTPAAVLLMVVVSIIVGVAIGSLYGWGLPKVPYAKLRIVITFLTGLALGGIVGVLATAQHVRNRGIVVAASILGSLVLVYTAWVWWMAMMIDAPVMNVLRFMSPKDIYNIANEAAVDGVWSYGKTTPKGWELKAFWAGELLAIVATGIGTAYAAAFKNPYCEATGQWLTETTKSLLIAHSEKDNLTSSVSNGSFRGISTMALSDGTPGPTLQLSVQRPATKREIATATVTLTEMAAPDKQGNMKSKTLLKNIVVDANSAADAIAGIEALNARALANLTPPTA